MPFQFETKENYHLSESLVDGLELNFLSKFAIHKTLESLKIKQLPATGVLHRLLALFAGISNENPKSLDSKTAAID